MPYQNPNTGEWFNDDGSPLYSYLPPNYDAYVDPSAPPPTAAAQAAAPVPTPTAGTAGAGAAPDFGALPIWQQPIRQDLPDLPGVGAAPSFDFKAPTIDEALSDPSYAFRRSQGEGSLQRWAAAKGTLNDSSTAEALINYGQNAAAQEYSSIWNRKYQVAKDAYAPQLATWDAQNGRSGLGYTTQASNVMNNNNLDYQADWNKFMADQDFYKWKVDNALKYAGA